MIWTILWVIWIIGFFAVEIPAIIHEKRHGSGATLSAHVRSWFSTMKHDKAWRIRRLVLLFLLVWLVVHFFAGW